MSLQQYNQYPTLSQVRLASSSNQSGTYNNGPLNNGVGATFTYATGALTIDSVTVNVGDRILFQGQTNANENGIYVCNVAGATGVSAVLQRASDMQCIEQMKAGQYVSVGAGSVNAGNFYTIVEPLPAIFGVSNFVLNADPSAGGVTFSGAASTANALAVFSDTAGNLKAQSTASTLGFGLTIQTGDFAVSQGNVTAGSSGHAGQLASFPGTAANGSFIFKAINNAGNFNSTLSNANIGQATVYTLPDSGQATTNVLLSDNATTQNINTGNLAVLLGNVQAGSSGHAGFFTSFPGTAANGSFLFKAVNNASNFASTLSNSAVGQATTYTLNDPGAATSVVQSSAITSYVGTVPLLLSFDITVGQAALAAGGAVTLIASSGTKQFKIRSLQLNSGGTNFSGGGGDRLGQVTDGTTVYSVVPAATMQSLVNAQWGVTALPNPAAAAINTSTAAGAALTFKYSGGATDYTAGSLVITGIVEQVVS
jgi:hypothetical protein